MQRRMLGSDRCDDEAHLVEAAAHLMEGTVECLIHAERVISLDLFSDGGGRKPVPSRLDAAGDAGCNCPLASQVLGQPMDERHEEMRLDGSQLAGIDMKAASSRGGNASDLSGHRVKVGDVLEDIMREDEVEEVRR